jgi:Bacterial mobilisation protein (MobC)
MPEPSTRKRRGPHHSSPCGWPTRSGHPCSWQGVHDHEEFGLICDFHLTRLLANQHLTHQVLMRFSGSDHRRLRLIADATGHSIQALLRAHALGLKPPKPLPPLADNVLLSALGRIGGNVNQIAKSLHRIESDVHAQVEASLLAALQKEIRDLQERLIEVADQATARCPIEVEDSAEWEEAGAQSREHRVASGEVSR